jgi:hypothetical protein
MLSGTLESMELAILDRLNIGLLQLIKNKTNSLELELLRVDLYLICFSEVAVILVHVDSNLIWEINFNK